MAVVNKIIKVCSYSLWRIIGCIGLALLGDSAAGQENQFSYRFEPAKFNNRLFQHTISGLVKDDWGMLWISTQYGLYRFDGYNTEVFTSNNISWLTSDRYRGIFKESNGKKLVIAGENDYFFVQDGKLIPRQNTDSVLVVNNYNFLRTHKKRLTHLPGYRNESLFNSAILFLGSDTLIGHKEKWFSLKSGNQISYNGLQSMNAANIFYKSGKQYVFQKNGLYNLHLENDSLHSTLIARYPGFTHPIPGSDENAIWIENDREISKINLPDGKINRGFLKPTDHRFSPSVLEDVETGNIYLGSDKKGVLAVRATRRKVLAPENLNSSYCFNKKSMAYMVPTNEGIGSFSLKDHQSSFYKPKDDLRTISIFSDKNDRVWFQTNDETTWIVDHTLRKVISEITNMDLLISAEQIDENNFLLSGHHVLYEYNLKTKSRKNKYTLPEEERINDFTSKDGLLYVSTSNGLHVLNKQYEKIDHLLNGVHVRKTISWKQGSMVIATYGKGVYILKDKKIYSSQTKRNPHLSAVVNLATDSDNALWVICNKAAFVWNELRLTPELINDPDHVLYVQKELPCSELNGGLTPDVFPNNDILLPSSDGLLILKKEDIIKPLRQYKVGISKVQVDDSLILDQTGFAIPAGNNQVRFFLDAANLDAHRDYIPRYRISGLDSQWQFVPDHRMIELKRLPRGTYHLEILKHPADKPLIISTFTVRPFWYETIWARILMIISAIGMIYFIVKLRVRSIEAQNIKLEQIIDEKTKSLQENIIKLDASEKNLRQQYKYRNKLYSILVHDLKSPLSFLAAYSSKQLAEKQVIEMDTMRTIAKSSTELSTYVNEFLYWLGNQYSPENIQIATTNISTLLEEVADFYQNVATINENRLFFFDKEKNIKFLTDANRLKIVIRNLLDNANKYTTKGIIKISHLLDQDGSLIIKIEDSGKGLPDNIISLIHDQSSTQQIAPNINANYKMGLMISKELVEQLGGKISVVSDEKTGTNFILTFTAAQKIHAG